MCVPSHALPQPVESETYAWRVHTISQNQYLPSPGLGVGRRSRESPGSGPTLPWHGWLQKEEELRKEEERKKALDERLRFEQERMEQERQEQEERERRYREREQQIEEHRCAQLRPTEALPHASRPTWACPKGCMLVYFPRRKQQTLEAEEAKRRLKEQSIFVSS